MNKKYLTEYRTETVIDSRGRERRVARYIGPYFSCPLDKRALRAARIVLALAALLCAALFVAAAVADGGAMRRFYSAPLFAASVLPIFFMLAAVIEMKCGLLTRRESDAGAPRYRSAALAGAVLSGAAFIGGIIGACIHGWDLREAAFAACSAAMTAAFLLARRYAARAICVETEK
jgi:hypothetical protein